MSLVFIPFAAACIVASGKWPLFSTIGVWNGHGHGSDTKTWQARPVCA